MDKNNDRLDSPFFQFKNHFDFEESAYWIQQHLPNQVRPYYIRIETDRYNKLGEILSLCSRTSLKLEWLKNIVQDREEKKAREIRDLIVSVNDLSREFALFRNFTFQKFDHLSKELKYSQTGRGVENESECTTKTATTSSPRRM